MMGHGHHYSLILVELLEMEYPPIGKTLEVESPPPISRRTFLPKDSDFTVFIFWGQVYFLELLQKLSRI